MKRFIWMLLCCLFLAGCGFEANAENEAISFRQKISGSAGCSFCCTVTADYSDRIYSFTLQCSFDRNGNMDFSVTEPESICGITGKMDPEGGKLTFDDQILMFPMLADGYISPVSAPWLMIKALRGGYIHSAVKTEEGYYFVYQDSFCQEPLQIDLWSDDSVNPYAAEILWNGRRILTLTVTSFSCL